MDRRLIFPITMFVLAGISFAYGTYEYVVAQRAQSSSDARLAFIMSAIESSRSSRQEKTDLYAAIFQGLPKAPSVFGFDLSGSFAAPAGGDQCTSDGQRAVCGALIKTHEDPAMISRICGLCLPK